MLNVNFVGPVGGVEEKTSGAGKVYKTGYVTHLQAGKPGEGSTPVRVNVVVFGTEAANFNENTIVAISGKLEVKSYKPKDSEEYKQSLQIIVGSIEVVGTSSASAGDSSSTSDPW